MRLSTATFNRITLVIHWFSYSVKVRQQVKDNDF